MDLEAERRRDVLGEDPAKGAPGRVESPDQLALVPAEADPVVAMTGTRLPQRALSSDHRGEAVEVLQQSHVERLVDDGQARLVTEQLAHGHAVLARLREFRPVGGDALVVVEAAARVRQRQRHRRQPLGRRVDQDERVLRPRCARASVTHAAPQVDHLLAAAVRRAGSAQLAAFGEVSLELRPHELEPGRDESVGPRASHRRLWPTDRLRFHSTQATPARPSAATTRHIARGNSEMRPSGASRRSGPNASGVTVSASSSP